MAGDSESKTATPHPRDYKMPEKRAYLVIPTTCQPNAHPLSLHSSRCLHGVWPCSLFTLSLHSTFVSDWWANGALQLEARDVSHWTCCFVTELYRLCHMHLLYIMLVNCCEIRPVTTIGRPTCTVHCRPIRLHCGWMVVSLHRRAKLWSC